MTPTLTTNDESQKCSTIRDLFFAYLQGDSLEHPLFFPDLSTWYERHRTPAGQPQAFPPGGFISDAAALHCQPGTMPLDHQEGTLLDIYRRYGWGLPVHLYNWCRLVQQNCDVHAEETNGLRTIHYKTPLGQLQKKFQMADDGSWAPIELPVKELMDLSIMEQLASDQKIEIDEQAYWSFREETEGFGVADIVINRSPFGKLVHEYLGFEKTIYALVDDKTRIEEFLAIQEQADLAVIQAAAKYPAQIVIISDHADQTLISPPYYQTYCLPFYQKACKILHEAGKRVSTHLDGNFKGYFPFLKQTGFDLLDGCTPAPMFNYEAEELALLCKQQGLKTYCGVPSALFVDGTAPSKLVEFAKRIIQAFEKQVIVNIGDILPPNSDLNSVIAIGNAVREIG